MIFWYILWVSTALMLSVAILHGETGPTDPCGPKSYDPALYHYPADIERRILTKQPLISPYSGKIFDSTRESDIEHVVSRREAHFSGLCARPDSVKAAFAQDLDNLTLATPEVNRYQKRAFDVAQWRPALKSSWCWMASTVIKVKRKYRLTIDKAERAALVEMLRTCNE